MVAMAEHGFENISPGRRSTIRRELVTNIAGADLALRCVTRVAVRVCLNANRETLSRSGGFVTRRAALGGATLSRDMSGVYEFHIEAFIEALRKLIHRRRVGFHVTVTDRAHRLLFGIRELADVTTDAGIVSGKFEIRRSTFATMTRVTFEFLMLGYAVRERLELPV
jgi:hypothetical protein